MARLQVWGAAAAALLFAFVGGGAWVLHQLGIARAEGVAAGRAEVTLAVNVAAARQRAAADAALAVTNAQVAELERSRDQLQEGYNAMLAQAIRDARGDRLCLGAGVVRALGSIGRDAGSPGARP